MEMKRLAINSAIVLGTLAVLILLWEFRGALILFLLSLAAAATTRPIIDTLIAKGVKRGLAIFLVYFFLLSILIGVFVLVIGPLLTELQTIVDNLAMTYERIWREWPGGTAIQKAIVSQLPPPQEFYSSLTGERGIAILQTFLGVTFTSFNIITQFFAVIILSIYWSFDRIHFERLFLSLLSVNVRARAREIWRGIEDGVGAYIRSELLQSLLAGFLLWIGFQLIGIGFPTTLAIIGALAWLIPWFGAALAVIPVVLVGFSNGLWVGISATLLTMVVLLVMELIIEPRLIQRRQYSSLLVIIMIIAMADIFGLVGILISPPLAAAIQIFVGQLFFQTSQDPDLESVRRIVDLDQRITGVHEMIANLEEQPSPHASSMLDRLDRLVDEAQDLLTEIQRA